MKAFARRQALTRVTWNASTLLGPRTRRRPWTERVMLPRLGTDPSIAAGGVAGQRYRHRARAVAVVGGPSALTCWSAWAHA